MAFFTKVLLSPEFWGLATPLLAGVIAWFVNERSKRSWHQQERREEKYVALVKASDAFYVSASDPRAARETFLAEVRLAWLYCSDEVIQAAYAFLDTVKSGSPSTPQEKEASLGRLMVAIRADQLSPKLIRKSKLGPRDFRHLMVNK
jgi:hypothetical protein